MASSNTPAEPEIGMTRRPRRNPRVLFALGVLAILLIALAWITAMAVLEPVDRADPTPGVVTPAD